MWKIFSGKGLDAPCCEGQRVAAVIASNRAGGPRVRLVLVAPFGWPPVARLDEVLDALEEAFQVLGWQVERAINSFCHNSLNLVFVPSLLWPELADRLPANTILYNFEQLFARSVDVHPCILALMRRLPVWDYSPANMEMLRALAGPERAHCVPVGYMPTLSRIPTGRRKDIDVFFCGALNKRRRRILDALQDTGLVVRAVRNLYGAERDRLIARSKVVLNVKYHDTNCFESVRVHYMLANRKAVVTECGPDSDIDPSLRDGLVAVPYEHLVETTRALVAGAPRRRAMVKWGFEAIRQHNMVEILRKALSDSGKPYPPEGPRAKRLLVGSVVSGPDAMVLEFLLSLQKLPRDCEVHFMFVEKYLSPVGKQLLTDFAESEAGMVRIIEGDGPQGIWEWAAAGDYDEVRLIDCCASQVAQTVQG